MEDLSWWGSGLYDLDPLYQKKTVQIFLCPWKMLVGMYLNIWVLQNRCKNEGHLLSLSKIYICLLLTPYWQFCIFNLFFLGVGKHMHVAYSLCLSGISSAAHQMEFKCNCFSSRFYFYSTDIGMEAFNIWLKFFFGGRRENHWNLVSFLTVFLFFPFLKKKLIS